MNILMGNEMDVIKREICEIGRMMYEKGFVSACEGNISVRVSDHEIWTTPSGVCKGMLTPDMFVKINIHGEAENGKPSSEIKMHLRIYRERRDIMAVVHAHPIYACVYAVTGKALDKKYLTESVITLGEVPVAPYATPSTDAVGESVAPFLHEHKAAFLSNHGALTWGRTLREAYFLMESLEAAAKVTYLADLAGGGREISPEEAEILRRMANKQA